MKLFGAATVQPTIGTAPTVRAQDDAGRQKSCGKPGFALDPDGTPAALAARMEKTGRHPLD